VDRIISPGRIFIAISLVVFAIQHFLYANFVATLVPAWIPGRLFWAYFVGVAFVAAAIGAVVPKMTRPAGILLGILFFLFVVTLHIPRIAAHSRDGNEWTSGFVALAMCGGAWILAGATSLEDERKSTVSFPKLGRYFFSLAMLAFGVQHFIDERMTIRVGPPWFPGRPLWAYLTGAALAATGISIFLGQKPRLAATLLGTLLFLFFLFLHIPRVLANLRDPGPWTSGFEILALCGSALVLAAALQSQQR
jgi:uncharacterized membrane protein